MYGRTFFQRTCWSWNTVSLTNSLNPISNLLIIITFSTLNNNNLTTLPHNVFNGLSRLRALRLSDNPLSCDCHLSWLSRFLRSAPRLAPYTRCQSPSQLKGQNVADLHDQEFKCSGQSKIYKFYCSYFNILNSSIYFLYFRPYWKCAAGMWIGEQLSSSMSLRGRHCWLSWKKPYQCPCYLTRWHYRIVSNIITNILPCNAIYI